jgi:hypothetical protein
VRTSRVPVKIQVTWTGSTIDELRLILRLVLPRNHRETESAFLVDPELIEYRFAAWFAALADPRIRHEQEKHVAYT